MPYLQSLALVRDQLLVAAAEQGTRSARQREDRLRAALSLVVDQVLHRPFERDVALFEHLGGMGILRLQRHHLDRTDILHPKQEVLVIDVERCRGGG